MQEEIVLKSGRVLTPNNGILGLERRDNRWYMTEGYDNFSDEDSSWGNERSQLTKAEREEISTMMIGRWLDWAHKR